MSHARSLIWVATALSLFSFSAHAAGDRNETAGRFAVDVDGQHSEQIQKLEADTSVTVRKEAREAVEHRPVGAPAGGKSMDPNAGKAGFEKDLEHARTLDAADKAKEAAKEAAPGLSAPKQDEHLQKQGAKYAKDKADAKAAQEAAEEKKKKEKSCLSSYETSFKIGAAKFQGMCHSGPNALCKPEIYEQYKKVKDKYEACKQKCIQ